VKATTDGCGGLQFTEDASPAVQVSRSSQRRQEARPVFSIPFLLQYNPAVISVEEVRRGGFLQAGDQEIAIVQKVDKEHGQRPVNQTQWG
jgi:hypothetical protein